MAGADARQPQYLQLARALERQIGRGRPAVGALLPTESALCETHGVSRHTVREALRCLSNLGLVVRRQGSGTQVIAAEARPAYTQSLGSIAELLQYAKDTYLELGPRQAIAARGGLARLLDCPPGRRWLKYSGLRRSEVGGAPICTTDVYIDPRFAGIERRLGQERQAIYRLIEEVYGETVAEIGQRIAAISVPASAAEALGVAAGVPALQIVRRYFGAAGKAFEVSVSIHPADRFTYAMRIRRDSA